MLRPTLLRIVAQFHCHNAIRDVTIDVMEILTWLVTSADTTHQRETNKFNPTPRYIPGSLKLASKPQTRNKNEVFHMDDSI